MPKYCRGPLDAQTITSITKDLQPTHEKPVIDRKLHFILIVQFRHSCTNYK